MAVAVARQSAPTLRAGLSEPQHISVMLLGFLDVVSCMELERSGWGTSCYTVGALTCSHPVSGVWGGMLRPSQGPSYFCI